MDTENQCYGCNNVVKKSERYERSFEIIDYDEKGNKIKQTVNAYACSTKCLHDWYNTQDKWITPESEYYHKHRICNTGYGY